MKKIIKTFFIFLVFLTLSGCGFFGGSEKVISNITTEEKDGKLYLVVTYTDEYIEPEYFELKQGKDGVRGNGIDKILTDDKTKPGFTLVTVKYTDTSLKDEKFELPHGASIENIEVVPKVDKDGNPLVDENGEPTGEEELLITFTSGKEPIRIPYNKPKDGKDGREIVISTLDGKIVWKYEDEDDNSWNELVEIESLKGKDGSSIKSISVVEDKGSYYLSVTYHDKDVPELVLFDQLQKPSQWHTGNNYPPSNLGTVGDFFLDKTNAKIYQKQSETQWGEPIVDFGSPNGIHTVTFITDMGTIKGKEQIKISHGNCVYNDEDGETIPYVDAPDGYEFKGWILSDMPEVDYYGIFGIYTPVYKDITLKAYFVPINE